MPENEENKSLIKNVYEECPEYFELSLGRKAVREDVEDLYSETPEGKSQKDKVIYGIYFQESMVGVIDLIIDYPKKGTGFIGQFVVSASCQGQGYARNALLKLEESINYKAYRLVVNQNNINAREFWNHIGFEETGEEISYTHNGFSGVNIVMEKICKKS